MKQCFGYVRVSTVKQGEGVSLEAQKDAITAFAERNDLIISKWFEERETAAKSGRRLFDSMVKDLHHGAAAGLVIHKIDRSARNPADWIKIGELSDSGVDVHFVTESLDFRSRGGRLTADIQAVIAADYIRNLREETRKGFVGRLKQGLYPLPAPIGYLDKGRGKPKEPDPLRAPFIRDAFDLYASGQYSIRALLPVLAKRGLRNRVNGPVTKCGLENILKNPFYCGLIRIKSTGETYEGVHEPLITAELFQRVQDIKSGRAVKKVTRHHFPFRGLFRCGVCHAAMIPERQKGHVYYRCQSKACPTKTVRQETLDTEVWLTLRKSRLSETDVAYLTEKFMCWIATRKRADLRLPLTNQIAQIDAKLDKLTDALIEHLIDQDAFSHRKERLLLEKAGLQSRLDDMDQQGASEDDVRKFLELAKGLTGSYLLGNEAEKREIAEIATSNRLVFGRSPQLEPSNWLCEVSDAVSALSGPPERTTNRTGSRASSEVRERQLEILLSSMKHCPLITTSTQSDPRVPPEDRV